MDEKRKRRLDKLTAFKVALEEVEWRIGGRLHLEIDTSKENEDITIKYETFHDCDVNTLLELAKEHKLNLFFRSEGEIIVF